MKSGVEPFVIALMILSIPFQVSSQESLIDLDKERLFQINDHLVKNFDSRVILDKAFEQKGLKITQVGFRKNPNTEKSELRII